MRGTRGLARAAAAALAIVGLVGAGVTVTPLGARADETSTISGTVALPDGAPSEWLRAINVNAERVGGDGSSLGVGVDAQTGAYEITGLAPGDYRVSFSAGTYWDSEAGQSVAVNLLPEYYDGATNSDAARVVTTSAATPATGIDASLAFGAAISGTISLPAHSPGSWWDAVGVSVTSVSGDSSPSVVSIDRATGEYVVYGLAPGDYRVYFSAGSYWDAASGENVPTGLISEYYDGTTDPNSATTVSTSVDSPATEIDASLEVGASISGTITLPSGSPAEWWNAINVYAQAAEGNAPPTWGSIDRETGRYSLQGLAPGDYRVHFSVGSYWDPSVGASIPVNLLSEYFDSANDYGAASIVSVSASVPATGIDASLEPGSSIGGTITLPASAPTSWWDAVYVTAESSNGSSIGQTATPNPQTGRYELSGLPAGDYRIRFGVYSGTGANLIPQYFNGVAGSSSATVVSTAPASPANGIDAVLRSGASISGIITLPAGMPDSAWDSFYVSATPVVGSGFGGSGAVDRTTGRYTISGLAEGDYRVQFSALSNAGVNLISEYYDNTTSFSEAKSVTTTIAAPATGINASLEQGTTISGKVSLPANAPAAWMDSISVSASPLSGSYVSQSLSIDRRSGDYTISGLPAGDYRVHFSVSSISDVNLISEYYDGATDFSAAKTVTTTASAPATGINASLDSGSVISGTVSLPAGAPAAWWNAVSVYATPTMGGAGGGYGRVNPDDGSYKIAGLPAGDYKVQFSAGSYWDSTVGQSVESNLISEWYDDKTDYDSATPIATAPNFPARGIDAALERGAAISGTLRDAGGRPAAGVSLLAVDARDAGSIAGWAYSDDTGAYSLTRLPAGTYKVFVGDGGEQPTYRRTYVGGANFGSATAIDLAAGQTVSGQNATLAAAVPNAPRPGRPSLHVGEVIDGVAQVTWQAPSSADPVVAYDWRIESGRSGGGDMQAASTSVNSLSARANDASVLVSVSAVTGSATGPASAVAVNKPGDPTAPSLKVSKSGDALVVTATTSAPSGASWWFVVIPNDASTYGMKWFDADSGSMTVEGLDLSKDVRVFGGWYGGGGKGSQIASTTYSPSQSGPAVHPWFQAKYNELGGAAGQLGKPVKNMECQSSSCWQQFEGGVLTSDGAQIVRLSTAYVTTWLSNGGPDGKLGLVAGPESCFGTYCVTPFTHGVIKWTPNVGVSPIVVNAWFEAKWKELGGLTGAIGSPVQAMQCQSSSCWQEFSGGVLTSDGKQIVKLSTAYVSTWLSWGGPDGDLGLVAGAESCFGTYCQTPFAGGVIVWVPNNGVFPVAKKWFYTPWVARGGAAGVLGLPSDSMRCQSSACYQVFQKGTLTSSTTGVESISSAYVQKWLASGGPDGPLGLLTGAEQCYGTYCEVPFQKGYMIWDPNTGVRVELLTNPGDVKNCSDFSRQRDAQAWFDRYYPLYGDVARLDSDNNGIACESLR